MNRFRPLLFALLLGAPLLTAAESRYVTDDLAIDLRGGIGTEYRILRMLPAGAPLEVLEQRDGWSRVRSGNVEGWMLSRFIASEPAARTRLADAEARADRLEAENAALQQEMAETRAAHGQMQDELSNLRRAWDELQREHSTLAASAAEPQRLMAENRQLREQLAALEQLAERQELENAVLRTDVQRDWLIAGAGVLTAGLLLGLILPPLLRRRRRSSEWV